jgi:putative Holliday junction resolvase
MRVLAVDFGRVRIGLAEGDPAVGLATPRAPINATGTLAKDAANIAAAARQASAELVALGWPIHDDPKAARIAERLADLIRAEGLPTELVDESLTTVESHDAMREAGLTAAQRKKRVDSEAACRILVRYFNGNGN